MLERHLLDSSRGHADQPIGSRVGISAILLIIDREEVYNFAAQSAGPELLSIVSCLWIIYSVLLIFHACVCFPLIVPRCKDLLEYTGVWCAISNADFDGSNVDLFAADSLHRDTDGRKPGDGTPVKRPVVVACEATIGC